MVQAMELANDACITVGFLHDTPFGCGPSLDPTWMWKTSCTELPIRRGKNTKILTPHLYHQIFCMYSNDSENRNQSYSWTFIHDCPLEGERTQKFLLLTYVTRPFACTQMIRETETSLTPKLSYVIELQCLSPNIQLWTSKKCIKHARPCSGGT